MAPSLSPLSAFVRDQLAAGHPAAAHRFVAASVTERTDTEAEELKKLNRYWRRQLASLSVDTIEARECLLDDCDAESWKRLFSVHVCPLIAAHDLPML